MEILECEDFEHHSRVEPKHVSALKEAVACIDCTQKTLKAWARYTHSMTEQHRLMLLHAWTDFQKAVDEVESFKPPAHRALQKKAVVSDLVKGAVVRSMSSGDEAHAVRSVFLDTLVKGHGLTLEDATAIQSATLQDVLKKVVRSDSKRKVSRRSKDGLDFEDGRHRRQGVQCHLRPHRTKASFAF